MFHRDVTTTVAGRTDAGVHALGQVINCVGPDDADPDVVIRAINGHCAPAIVAGACRPVRDGWSARFDARSRLYVYALFESDTPDPFLARTTFRRPPGVDVDLMNEAAGHLLGEHDFSSFGRVVHADASPVRTLYELRVQRAGSVIRVIARANAFIQQMVRSLVGTLVEVGENKRTPDSMLEVLEARDRAAAGRVAPPEGLCLVAVEYDDGWSRPVDLPE